MPAVMAVRTDPSISVRVAFAKSLSKIAKIGLKLLEIRLESKLERQNQKAG